MKSVFLKNRNSPKLHRIVSARAGTDARMENVNRSKSKVLCNLKN